MKSVKLFLSALVTFFSFNLFAQWNPVTHLVGTQSISGVNVTVSSVNGLSGGGCGGLYWIQQSGDSYTFDFATPVAGVTLDLDALNMSESVEFYINGVMFPVLTCNMDTAQFVNNCSYDNCDIVNGQLVNTHTTWWICGGKLTFYGPINTFKVQEPIGGSGATFNISFATTGTNIGGCITQTSTLGMFTVSANKTCAGLSINNIVSTYTTGQEIITWYGDGTTDTTTVLPGTGAGYAYFTHDYAASGNYTVKQVLYQSGAAVDSLIFNHDHLFCTDIPIQFYQDVNSNCVFDNGDVQPFLPILVEVDSNGMHIDTLSLTSGGYYRAYGIPGDVYDFNIISLPGNMVPTCPVTGSISLTLQNLVYYTAPNYMGFDCGTSTNYDLGILASISAGAFLSNGHILASNGYCLPTNAVLTLTFSPKYVWGWSYPAPSTQVGNTATWNLAGLSTPLNPLEYVTYHLSDNGAPLTIGDTVHTALTIAPTTNDMNIADNTIYSVDTVTGPYDPNAIYVDPESCVLPGTQLKYTVTFENIGNAPAVNIYVMDTLSPGLEFSSFRMLAASHPMLVSKLTSGGYNILKFEFPGINLPGGTSPDRHGAIMYTLDMDDNFPIGSSVTNKAGIYFDYMPAILTNVASTTACWPTDVSNTMVANNNIHIYPNPATEQLTIKTTDAYSAFTITNSIGQVMMEQALSGKETQVNIKSLASGVYYISLQGESGTEVRKFVKM